VAPEPGFTGGAIGWAGLTNEVAPEPGFTGGAIGCAGLTNEVAPEPGFTGGAIGWAGLTNEVAPEPGLAGGAGLAGLVSAEFVPTGTSAPPEHAPSPRAAIVAKTR
jgi:hypothetical protein